VLYTSFTLDKFYTLPAEEIVGLFFLGELIYGFDIQTILLVAIGPFLALLYAIYLLYRFRRNSTAKYRTQISFLFVAYLIILIDYRILKLFMAELPFNAERLWVIDGFLASPFLGLAICSATSSLKKLLKTTSPQTMSIISRSSLSWRRVLRIGGLLFTLNILTPIILGGWISYSLHTAYPQIAPLQTTWYELEAVKYIEENTKEKYIVIGDQWTTFAGEVIVGVNNPRAYYFLEFNRTGYDLFRKILEDPSPQVMIEAMNVNNARVAYFIVTEPRLGTEEFNRVVYQTLKNQQLRVFGIFGGGKLFVFTYEKT